MDGDHLGIRSDSAALAKIMPAVLAQTDQLRTRSTPRRIMTAS
jgi:hypothetical protein